MPRITKRSLIVLLFGLGLPIVAALLMREIVSNSKGFAHRHEAAVTTLAVDPNERYVVTSDSDGKLRRTDLATGNVANLPPYSLARLLFFKGQSNLALGIAYDGFTQFIDFTEPPAATFAVPAGQTTNGNPLLANVADGSIAVAGRSDRYRVARWTSRGTIEQTDDLPARPTAIAATNDGLEGLHLIALGFADGRVGVVTNTGSSTQAANQQSTIQSGKPDTAGANLIMSDMITDVDRSAIVAVVVVPDGSVVSVDQNGAIIHWSLEQSKGLQLVERARSTTSLPARTEVVAVKGGSNLALSHDGSRIAVSLQDGIAVFDTTSGDQISLLKGLIGKAEFSPDDQRIAAQPFASDFQVWDVGSGSFLFELKGSAGASSIRYHPNEERLVTAGVDRTISVWHSVLGGLLFTLDGGSTYARISSDGERLITAVGRNVGIWSIRSWRLLLAFPTGNGFVFDAEFSPDANSVMTTEDATLPNAQSNARIKIWDAKTGNQHGLLEGRMTTALNASFAPKGAFIVTSDRQGTGIWDALSYENVLVIPGLREAVAGGGGLFGIAEDDSITRIDLSDLDRRCLSCVALRYERPATEGEAGRILAVERNGRVKVFDLADLSKAPTIRYPAMEGKVVAYDQETGAMAIANGKRQIIQTANAVMEYEGDEIAQIRGLADGRLVIGALDGSVRIVDPGLQGTLAAADMVPELGAWVSATWTAFFEPAPASPPPETGGEATAQ